MKKKAARDPKAEYKASFLRKLKPEDREEAGTLFERAVHFGPPIPLRTTAFNWAKLAQDEHFESRYGVMTVPGEPDQLVIYDNSPAPDYVETRARIEEAIHAIGCIVIERQHCSCETFDPNSFEIVLMRDYTAAWLVQLQGVTREQLSDRVQRAILGDTPPLTAMGGVA